MQVARFLEQATMSHCYEKNPAVKYKKLLNLDLHPPWVDLHPPWVVKSSQLLVLDGYSAWHFFTDGVIKIECPWTGHLFWQLSHLLQNFLTTMPTFNASIFLVWIEVSLSSVEVISSATL